MIVKVLLAVFHDPQKMTYHFHNKYLLKKKEKVGRIMDDDDTKTGEEKLVCIEQSSVISVAVIVIKTEFPKCDTRFFFSEESSHHNRGLLLSPDQVSH